MKERLMHNLGLKIVSVIVAAFVWLIIMNIDDPTITHTFSNIPVQVINDDVLTSRGYQYSIESGDKVDIKVQGRRSIIDNLTESDFEAYADFSSLSEKSMYFATISAKCLADSADELTLTLKNETMAIKREEQVTKPFNVRVNFEGEVREGYYRYESKVSSTLIQVTGSESQIAAVKEVAVDVNIDGKYETFTSDYKLVAYDSDDNPIDAKKLGFSEEIVSITVGICPTASVGVKVVTEGDPAEGYFVDKVEYAPANVMIAAPEAMLSRLKMIEVPCDITGASETKEFQKNLSDLLQKKYDDVYMAVDDSSTICIVVTILPVSQKVVDIESSDITVRNLNDAFSYEIYSMWNTSVIVSGPEVDIKDIEPIDLALYVDLTGCVEGTYSRQIRCDLGNGIKIEAGSVMVRVTEKTN